MAATEDATTVWFHRNFLRLTGGHLKHAHYFDHVRRLPGYVPRISFTAEPGASHHPDQRRLWPPRKGAYAERWRPSRPDIFFLAGLDWRYLIDNGLDASPNPRINLIQHVRHAHEDTELHSYLKQRAVRICVSEEVAQALLATGEVNGPVFTIANGMRTPPAIALHRFAADLLPRRRRSVIVVGYKRPELANALSERLTDAKVPHQLLLDFLPREQFLAALAGAEVTVCLPNAEEGFYLPALEAMACGSVVVTLDCIGNRSFCHNLENCLVAPEDPDTLTAATIHALALYPKARKALRRRADETVHQHSLAKERQRFHEILGNIHSIW
ncbi:glycosyltransferase family 4 protein [Candidatus Saccharibacteria bacterium]|nr:glycosyltransferase family 4 protein [Gammaproteobacteria bacterium]MYB40455.1 glycosyltransferase family 4 protein [Candidatus Saccharibacteria bacterium]